MSCEDGIGQPPTPTGASLLTETMLNFMLFGDGSDGDLVVNAGTTILTKNTYYNDVTLTGTAKIDTANYALFVAGTLDISNAPAGAIFNNGGAGGNGAAGGGAGTAGTQVHAQAGGQEYGSGVAGTAGGAGGVAGGSQAAAPALPAAGVQQGGASGASGAGGAGSGGAGGLSRNGSANQGGRAIHRMLALYYGGFSAATGQINFLSGGSGGPGGGGGGGDGTAGGGGGGGGCGGATVAIFARYLQRGGSTPAGCIQAKAGAGGNGGSPAAGNRGGGGSGSGGGGGWIVVTVGELLGSTATNAMDASGGASGTGGNGIGTGLGGNGGRGGAGGRITVVNGTLGVATESVGVATVPGNAAVGAVGGIAVNGEVLQASL